MRHGDYGLTNATALTDDEIRKKLPEGALTELEQASKNKTPAVTYIIQQTIEKFIDMDTEFTVTDLYVLIHSSDNPDAPSKPLKLQTVRTSLSNLANRENSGIEARPKAAKIRLYGRVSK